MEKRLSPKTLNRVLMRWYHGASMCGTYAMMCALGYACAMFPALNELYPDVEIRKKNLQTYGVYYNTEIFLGSAILGMNCALEEARANGNKEVDGEAINSIRTSLMGPVAGIGDSLVIGTYIPILLGIAVGLSGGGSILGPIFYVVTWNVTLLLFVRYMFKKGYTLGLEGVKLLTGSIAEAIKEAIVKVGLIVTGAVAATWIGVSTQFRLVNAAGNTYVDLQGTLNGIFPNLLTLAFIGLNWWLMAKKKVSPVVCILLMFVIAFVGVLVGFFDPGLSY